MREVMIIKSGNRVKVVNLKDFINPSYRDYPDIFLGKKGFIQCTNGNELCIEFDDADIDLLNNFKWHERNLKIIR